jgi:stearoyl-CoA desaturase (delta-9 desaturase)
LFRNITPVQNWFVSLLALGEGFHNYHHVFPWDSRAAELGNYRLNITNLFLDLMGKIGWAYERKIVSEEMIKSRKIRSGDGTITNVWGWSDPDQTENDKKYAKIIN